MGGLALAVTLGLHVRLNGIALLLSYQFIAPGRFPQRKRYGRLGRGAGLARLSRWPFRCLCHSLILSLVFTTVALWRHQQSHAAN